MGNWSYRGSELAKRLSEKTIQKGGVEQINAPILNCKVSSELDVLTVQMGGDVVLVNYNKHREKEHKKLKEQKRLRSLKKQITRLGSRRTGDELPSPETYHDSSRGHKS